LANKAKSEHDVVQLLFWRYKGGTIKQLGRAVFLGIITSTFGSGDR
jgi:hypothetical protein